MLRNNSTTSAVVDIYKHYPPYIQIGYGSQMIYPSLRQYEGGGSGRRDVSGIRPTSYTHIKTHHEIMEYLPYTLQN